MQRMSFRELLGFYRDELFSDILPFWMTRAIDEQRGGYYTGFSNDGARLIHKHKFTWSQGRFVWMLSRLSRALRKEGADKSGLFLHHASHGARFLIEHARLQNGNCAFILDEKGEPVLLDENGASRKASPGEHYDLSIYADCFVIYGVGEYARAADDRVSLEFALDLYDSVTARLDSGNYRSDPYPVPAGYKVHGIPMILLETSQELAEAAEHFGNLPRAARLREEAARCAREIMENFLQTEEKVILEMIGADNRPRDNLLGRYICPGHVIEDMWFVMHWAERVKDSRLFRRAVEVLRRNLDLGWDSEFGGIPQFLDQTGGPPQGEVPVELAGHEMVKKLRSNWANKLWWVHSEALYACLLAYDRMPEAWLSDWYWRIHRYTFDTFPNPDRTVGEWIQIRDRRGQPESKVMALPVKDPFHIVRALTLAIPVLERLAEKEG